MAPNFSVPALGKGSIASFIKVALDIVWVVLWGVACVIALAGIVCVGLLLAIQLGLLPEATLDGHAATTVGPLTIRSDVANRMFAPMLAPALLAAAVAVGGALIIVLRLKRLFKNFTSGEPFSRDNAGHLRVIWITMLVMEVSRYVIAGAVAAFIGIFGQPETIEISQQSPIDLSTWGSILILIVLAEVFREGARLKEEQELTI